MMVIGLLSIVGFFLDSLPKIEFDFGALASYADMATTLVLQGIEVLGAFIGPQGMTALSVYLGAIIVINSFYIAYQLVWWFIKKIPLLDISQ